MKNWHRRDQATAALCFLTGFEMITQGEIEHSRWRGLGKMCDVTAQVECENEKARSTRPFVTQILIPIIPESRVFAYRIGEMFCLIESAEKCLPSK